MRSRVLVVDDNERTREAIALYLRHAQAWEARWSRSDVVVGGDPEGQFALRYSMSRTLLPLVTSTAYASWLSPSRPKVRPAR